LDSKIVLWLNALTYNDVWAAIFLLMGNNALVRGGPVFFAFVLVWCSKPDPEHQVKILVGLVATMVATVSSVVLQFLFTPHIRPCLNSALPINQSVTDFSDLDLHRLSSFPSDSASLYFAICMIIFLENRKLGIVSFLWSILTVGVCRVALGYHYPTDIIGSLVLGPGLVLIASRMRVLQTYCTVQIRRFHISTPVLTAVMFLFLGDAYNEFLGILNFIHIIRHVTGLSA